MCSALERFKFSLKWLEVFQAIARSGSVRDAAKQLGISISTVSHHLTCLEREVGAALIDHQRRPMRLTAAGETLLQRVDEATGALHTGLAEIWSKDPAALIRNLKIALVEDFDTQVQPKLAAQFSNELPACQLSFLSRPSHEILSMLENGDIDIGVSWAPEFQPAQVTEVPLLRDPFVLVAPPGRTERAADYLNEAVGLPFLRYSKRQLIGRRIEAQLRRLRLDLPSRLVFENTSAILTMVAAGRAWSITTALNAISTRFALEQVEVMALPDAGFVRQLSIVHASELSPGIVELFDANIRPLVQDHVVVPTVKQVPWLKNDFRLLEP